MTTTLRELHAVTLQHVTFTASLSVGQIIQRWVNSQIFINNINEKNRADLLEACTQRSADHASQPNPCGFVAWLSLHSQLP